MTAQTETTVIAALALAAQKYADPSPCYEALRELFPDTDWDAWIAKADTSRDEAPWTPHALYRQMVEYVQQRGWKRDEPDSGWWWHPNHRDEMTLGEAVNGGLCADGVDVRQDPSA